MQAILLSIACYAAALSVAYWLGIWSALAFFAFGLVMIEPFLATTGSEPLSLVWAFLSIACLAHACRTGAVQSAVFTLGFLCMAQFTRMGAVLALGAVALWVLARPRYSAAHIARRIVLVVQRSGYRRIGILPKERLCGQSHFAPLGGISFGGWNLGILVCKIGAQVGWTECESLINSRVPGAANSVYSHVWALISANPSLILRPLVDNIHTFLLIGPRGLLFGYTEWPNSGITAPMILSVAVLPGLLWYLIKRAKPSELFLWPIFWLSIVVSSAVVFFDDGWRALYATHPWLIAFVAIAFTTPSSIRPSHVPMSSWKPLSLAGLAIILLLVAPWAVHRELSPRETLVRWQNWSAATVSGGSMITGFLVLPDGQAPDPEIASLSYSEFQAVLRFAKLDERWQGWGWMLPAPPFAVAWSPRIAKAQSLEIFIAPTDVLRDRAVTRWHFEVRREISFDPVLVIVRSATPIWDDR